MHKFEKKVYDTIIKHNMLSGGESVLAGFSGGADSTALVCALMSIGFKVCAAHINHGLRGADADFDMNFVQNFCTKNNIKCFVKKADVKKYAKEKRLSCEEAGRNVRYSYFYETADICGIDKIAVAHSKNDSVETSIFNFIRGASSGGLKGILPVNGRIVRPLIECSRDEIEEYLRDKNIEFVTDKTNFENEYSRNKIRNIIIKEMQKINPSLINTVFENGKILGEENDFICEYTKKTAEKCVVHQNGEVFLDLNKIKNEHVTVKKHLVIFCAKLIINDFHASAKFINSAVNLTRGKKIYLGNYGLTISNNYDILRFKVNFADDNTVFADKNGISGENKGFEYRIFDGNDINLQKIFDEINTKFDVSFVSFDEITDFNSASYICIDGIDEPIYIRNRRNGDKISVANVGTKKLKDIFIDRKINPDERDKIPVVATDDKILAVCGFAVGKDFFVNRESKRILMIKT